MIVPTKNGRLFIYAGDIYAVSERKVIRGKSTVWLATIHTAHWPEGMDTELTFEEMGEAIQSGLVDEAYTEAAVALAVGEQLGVQDEVAEGPRRLPVPERLTFGIAVMAAVLIGGLFVAFAAVLGLIWVSLRGAGL